VVVVVVVLWGGKVQVVMAVVVVGGQVRAGLGGCLVWAVPLQRLRHTPHLAGQ
jgi:hypothetical protein